MTKIKIEKALEKIPVIGESVGESFEVAKQKRAELLRGNHDEFVRTEIVVRYATQSFVFEGHYNNVYTKTKMIYVLGKGKIPTPSDTGKGEDALFYLSERVRGNLKNSQRENYIETEPIRVLEDLIIFE
jgi:hypothetical protein